MEVTNKKQHLSNMHPTSEQDSRRDQFEAGSWANPAPNSLWARAYEKGELSKLAKWRREYENDIEERLRWLTEEYGGDHQSDTRF